MSFAVGDIYRRRSRKIIVPEPALSLIRSKTPWKFPKRKKIDIIDELINKHKTPVLLKEEV